MVDSISEEQWDSLWQRTKKLIHPENIQSREEFQIRMMDFFFTPSSSGYRAESHDDIIAELWNIGISEGVINPVAEVVPKKKKNYRKWTAEETELIKASELKPGKLFENLMFKGRSKGSFYSKYYRIKKAERAG